MTNAIGVPVLSGLAFAAAGYAGVLLGAHTADRITPFADGPPSAQPPIPWIVAGCGTVGIAVAALGAPALQLALLASICAALAAVFVTDARTGIVPDVFTLGPLAIAIAAALLQRQWIWPFSIAVPLVPFAAAALLSRGYGMGWGDVKLAALGGAVLGAQLSILAFAAACLAAGVINYKRRKSAIAFAPYLATAIGTSIPFAVWH